MLLSSNSTWANIILKMANYFWFIVNKIKALLFFYWDYTILADINWYLSASVFLSCYAGLNDSVQCLPLVLVRVTGGLKPISATVGLDRSSVCRRANTQRQKTIPTHIHTYGQNRVNLTLPTECLERTFLLGGITDHNSANLCFILLQRTIFKYI